MTDFRCPDPPRKRVCCGINLGHGVAPWLEDTPDERVRKTLLGEQPVFLSLNRVPDSDWARLLPGPARIEVTFHGQPRQLFDWLEIPFTLALTQLVPYLDDDIGALENLIETASQKGCHHVLVGTVTEAGLTFRRYLQKRAPQRKDKILALLADGPSRDYRHRLYGLVRGLCDHRSLTFGVWEQPYQGEPFNRYFASSSCCRWPLGPVQE